MKARTLITTLLLLALGTLGVRSQEKVSLVYDLSFDGAFINNEYDNADEKLDQSGTVAAARISPYLGLRYDEGGAVHRIMAGADFMKDFGSYPVDATRGVGLDGVDKDIYQEAALWYQFEKTFGISDLTLAAGVFPRRLAEGRYSGLILSPEARFYDNNVEGLLLKLRRPRAHYEIALDWNGLYGAKTRERFNVFTYGEGRLGRFTLGWQGMFQHYADSYDVIGVVDDIVLNPFVEVDLLPGHEPFFLTLNAGPVVGYARDRRFTESKNLFGGRFVLDAGYRKLGLENSLYYGSSLCPYYLDQDDAGIVYAKNLYMRSPFYQVVLPEDGDSGAYDRLALFWNPRLGSRVGMKLSAVFHFATGGVYLQQIATLTFDLGPRTLRLGR